MNAAGACKYRFARTAQPFITSLHDLAPQERGVDCSAGDRCAAAEQEDEGDDFENAEGCVIIVLGA